MKLKLIYIIGFVLLLILSGVGGYLIGDSKEPQRIENVIYTTETFQDTTLITELKVKLKAQLKYIRFLKDSLGVIKIDTITIRDSIVDNLSTVAVADTLLTYVQDIDTAQIRIAYYFPPINEFDIGLRLSQRLKLKADSIYLPCNRTIFDRFSLGIGTGVGYNYLSEKFTGGVFIGIYYSLWDL